ncbi:M23 family metallopeptidase, partial [Candidatus Peregrinibacteria bacterium]|nr:M23 family metallopeptidase [Candidatus Peregrinibacteria bacterium]
VNGNHVFIDHENGWKTIYLHFESPSHLKVGDTVEAGELVGKIGSTGRSTAPHLHFEMQYKGTSVDPLHYL